MVNLCTFIGNLGKDPETKAISSGAKVSSFSIACTEKWRDKDSGDMKEVTEWINITCWRGLAETVEKYCRKGMKVYVAGKFKTQSWDDSDGKKHYKSYILAETVTFLSSAKEVAGSGGSKPAQGGGRPTPEDDLPF